MTRHKHKPNEVIAILKDGGGPLTVGDIIGLPSASYCRTCGVPMVQLPGIFSRWRAAPDGVECRKNWRGKQIWAIAGAKA